MKIIFLDVDGVLTRGSFTIETSKLDPQCLQELATLVAHTGAKIVVSSSWKCSQRKLDQLSEALKTVGLAFMDITAPEFKFPKREDEIHHWLDTHPDVENFVILDDWDLSSEFPNNMVLTCDYHRAGLDAEWRQEAEKILLK